MFILQLAFIAITLALVPLAYVWRFKKTDGLTQLACLTAWLTFDLIIFGSFTRLTDSGLGCPDWPGCYGTASPFAAHLDIQMAQQLAPHGFVTFKKAWIEMIHRYMAMMLGVLLIVQLAWAYLKRHTLRIPLIWPISLLGLLMVQGAFGAWTVTLKLQPIIVTTHLLLGLLLLTCLSAFASQRFIAHSIQSSPASMQQQSTLRQPHRWRLALWLGLILLIVQIALGGWVSAHYAMLACPDFPTCQGQWWPSMDIAQGFYPWRGRHSSGANLGTLTLEAQIAIHWMHRIMAGLVFMYFCLFLLLLRRYSSTLLKRTTHLLLGLLIVQIMTGVSNLLLPFPLWTALMHNAGAAAMLALCIFLDTQLAVQAPTLSRA